MEKDSSSLHFVIRIQGGLSGLFLFFERKMSSVLFNIHQYPFTFSIYYSSLSHCCTPLSPLPPSPPTSTTSSLLEAGSGSGLVDFLSFGSVRSNSAVDTNQLSVTHHLLHMLLPSLFLGHRTCRQPRLVLKGTTTWTCESTKLLHVLKA